MPKNSLNSLLLKNFRSYSTTTKINFGSRITLIFGKGSVGKSTIIDAIQTLHASDKNNTDLYDKNYKFLVSKRVKNKKEKKSKKGNISFPVSFSIGLSCKEKEVDGEFNIKSVVKDFAFTELYNFPIYVNLFSNEGSDQKDDPFSNSNRYLGMMNIPIEFNKNRNLKDFYISSVDFFGNQNSWQKLHESTNKYKNELITYLDKIEKFEKNYFQITDQISQVKKKNDNISLKKLESDRDKLFDKELYSEGFSAVWFPMYKERENYKKFIKKGSDLKTFINFVEENIKKNKRYLYKNNELFTRRTIKEKLSDKEFNELLDNIKKQLKGNYLIQGNTTLSEFLCYTLTEIVSLKEYRKVGGFQFPIVANKDSFVWNKEGGEIALSPEKIFDMCKNKISPVLGQIKTIRHRESFNDLIKSLSQYSSSATRQSEFNEIVEQNIRNINKWLKEFGYDFKIIIEKFGVNGESQIFHQKNGYKIPADLGGSGAQYLLTYLTELLEANENIILLEEPEKAVHASLQIKLAELFTEISKNNQLVIETHSENLLLGILKEIRDKNLNHQDVKVLYVYMEDGESKVDEVILNEKGGFRSKWRDGFFTEKLDLL